MMSFIRKHWKGDYSLGISFWFNFLFLIIAYHYAGRLIKPSFNNHPREFILATIIYLAISRLIVYPWQVIGLLRSCGRHFLTHGHVIRVRTVQAVVILSLLGTSIHILESAQSLIIFKNKINNKTQDQEHADYALSLIKNGRFIHLKGSLDFGVTNDVAKILSNHSDVKGIILDSSGGIVYEGRGLFMLIKKHGLDTYSFKNCSSACTIAFIGGARRFLGENAKLGFHQYRLDSDKINPIVDIENEQKNEQKKDLFLYESQMINDTFLNNIFEKPQHEIWFPIQNELLAAGVVDRIVNEVQP